MSADTSISISFLAERDQTVQILVDLVLQYSAVVFHKSNEVMRRSGKEPLYAVGLPVGDLSDAILGNGVVNVVHGLIQ